MVIAAAGFAERLECGWLGALMLAAAGGASAAVVSQLHGARCNCFKLAGTAWRSCVEERSAMFEVVCWPSAVSWGVCLRKCAGPLRDSSVLGCVPVDDMQLCVCVCLLCNINTLPAANVV